MLTLIAKKLFNLSLLSKNLADQEEHFLIEKDFYKTKDNFLDPIFFYC